ncbi:MAG: glycosyltransferase family 4 protein [Candidatus Omnitrophica bacterium]|nr:glycosyltransferase family 4 protein [Candidatus Omnitrophota bacterium]
MAKRKYSIAHLHWGFPPIIGGVETHLAMVLPFMAQRGHKVSLLTASAEGHGGKENFKSVDIVREPIMDLNWLTKRGLAGIEKEVVRVFTKFIETYKPDVLHTHNMHYFSKPHITILEKISQKKGIPLILSAHNIWDDLLCWELSTAIKWKHIIAVSHFIEKELIGLGCSHENITTVHHGIDERMFRPGINPRRVYNKYPRLRKRQVFFHPARMGLAKGCDVAIKALRLVKERIPDVLLVLAGTKNIIDWGLSQQKDIAYIIKLVDNFKLRDNVIIDSYPLELMPYMYAACDVCIYPSSVSEPFGLTMLEAMACAKPMVVTRAGGMPEIISDGVNGFVIPVRDFEELASRVTLLLKEKPIKERLGNTGRKMVEARFSKKHVSDLLLSLYKKFI